MRKIGIWSRALHEALVGVLELSKPIRVFSAFLPESLRQHPGRRAIGLMLALLIEALLVLALLTLGRMAPTPRFAAEQMSAFNVGPPAQKSDADNAKPREKSPQQQSSKATPRDTEQKPEVEPPVPLPPLIPMSARDMAAVDISRAPPRPARAPAAPQMSGPADSGASGDTPLMGTGPNGEPLYAAQWYRKPYDSELSGYLSTADGPGWGLIACKTEPDYRVDQCVVVDEYPSGSRIARAVLEAAWQFRVRAPRRGGRTLIGEWVGIRIDYEQRRR